MGQVRLTVAVHGIVVVVHGVERRLIKVPGRH